MQWPGLRELVIELAIMLAIVFGVALMGPFGTFQMGGLAARLGYWALMIVGGYAIVRPLIALAPVIAERLAFAEGAVWAALVLVAGVPVTLLVWFGGGGTEAPTAEAFLHLYPNVVLLGGVVALLFWLRRAMRVVVQPSAPVAVPAVSLPPAEAAASAEVSRAPADGGEPPLLARLPVHRRGRLRALEMEDHYVRVHTSAGTHMLLMRMRDAVAEVGSVAGEQVHRSWWVARDAVEGQAGQGRTVRLKLAGGLEAPVARASLARLRSLGWIG
jgi:hypothetical protein